MEAPMFSADSGIRRICVGPSQPKVPYSNLFAIKKIGGGGGGGMVLFHFGYLPLWFVGHLPSNISQTPHHQMLTESPFTFQIDVNSFWLSHADVDPSQQWLR